MTDSRQRVEVPITKHLEGLVQKGVPPATRTGLFSTPKFSFCDGQPVYLLRLSKTLFAETSQSSGFKACSMLSVYSNPMTFLRSMP
jgi:hypothetical protein